MKFLLNRRAINFHYLCIFILGVSLQLVGCIQYSPYEIRLKEHEKNLTEKAIRRIASLPATDTVCFAFIGDAQRFYDDALALTESINKQPGILFTIGAGDITDFGLVMEYQAMLQILSLLHMPFLTVVGNHDLLYNGYYIYQEMFGPFDFQFTYSGFRFVFVNTNSREFYFNGTVPNIALMAENLKDTANYKTAIVIAHIPPGNDDFDNRLNNKYINTLLSNPKVKLHLNGHNHDFRHFTWNDSNGRVINCYNSYSLDKRYYLVFKVWHSDSTSNPGYSVQTIKF